MQAEDLVAALSRMLTAQGFESIQTHLSVVLLGPHDVYKFKRPLNLGFVDFTQHEARKQACKAELTLNRRLADGVYLGLVGLSLDAQGKPQLEPVADEAALTDATCEWGVHMRRLPDSARADILLSQGELTRRDIVHIARMLAAFHAKCRGDAHTESFGTLACVAANVEENFAQVAHSIGRYLSPAEAERLQALQRAFLAGEEVLFGARIAHGRIRDGHGDLRLEHLYREPDGSFLAIDCIEFNERFRFADVASDLAFLAMDLRVQQEPQLSELLVADYASESGDYELYRVLDFYVSYRAVVRAKVRSMLALDAGAPADVRAEAEREVRRYYDVALQAVTARPERPSIIAFAGGIASGKSSLATAWSEERALPVLSSDRIRKQLLGVSPTTQKHDASFQGAYAPSMTQQVYAEVCARAEHVLASGRSVILDASFRSRAEREPVIALAKRLNASLLFVECKCSRETAMRRLEERAKRPSISDGRREIYDAFMQSFEPLSELPERALCRIDTDGPLEANVARLRDCIARSVGS